MRNQVSTPPTQSFSPEEDLLISHYRWTRTSVRKAALTALTLLAFAGALFAQDRNVSGTVTDAQDGSGLPGVNVLVKGTTNGTTTDVEGSYTLSVPGNATLVFSFIGYAPQEILVGNQSAINIKLASDVQALEEVVVIGYGTQEKKDVTGSIAQVSSKDFNAGINPNPLQAVQGKVAGLTITQPSGDPNQAPTVRLRGYTSLAGGSDPLYVVDGVIGVPISSIAPEDIQSIDVLKDASAAAIYGSRAANGVIIVTTKRGVSGKPQISFNNYVGVETISNRLELLDGNEYRAQVAGIKGQPSLSDNLRFPTDASGNGYSTDWIDEISRTGITNNHDLAVSGGGENFNYRGSLNYIKRDGIIKNTGFERVTGRINIDQYAINDKLKVQYNLSLSNTNSKLTDGGIIAEALTYLPTLPVRSDRTDFGGYYEVDGSFDLNNPVAMQDNFKNDEVKRVLIGGVNISYEIIDGLTVGVNGAYRNENTVNSQARNNAIKAYQAVQGGPNPENFPSARSLYQVNNKLLETTVNYNRNFGTSSNVSLLAGYSYQNNIDDGFSARNSDYIEGGYELFDGYNNLGRGRGTLLTGRSDYVNSYKNEYSLVSFFGRATVNLLDKYNITGTIRRDGSSKFGANSKWGVFPSFAAGWTISNETFLQNSNLLSYLKLRAGWGQTGNSEGIAPYRSIRLYGPGNNYFDGTIGESGDFTPGYVYSQNDNPDLKWEILEQTNIGLDFTLFDRINGTVDLYSKSTRDMLYNYTVPSNGNFVVNTITANVGEMRNRGIELSLGADVIKKENFNWNTRLVGSFNQNEIVSLESDLFDAPVIRYNPFGGRGLSGVFASELRQGESLGSFNLMPHFVGFADDGQVLLEAQDGGSTTDYSQALLKSAGSALPRYTASFINSFRYKNFDLNFQLRGVFGNKLLNNLRSNLAIPGSILETNMLEEVANYPVNYSTNQISDLWLEDGAFVRLDNWQIGYNIPVGGTIVQNARVYLGGNNLFIITDYKGIDPELEVRGDLQEQGRSQAPNNIGLDNNGIYPKTRTFQLGVNLTF